MEFLRFLRKESSDVWQRLVVVAFLAGVANAVLVSVILSAAGNVSPGDMQFYSLCLFALCFVSYVACRYFVMVQSAILSERIVCKLRLRMIEKIRNADLLCFEKIGSGPIYKVFSKDTVTLTQTTIVMATAFSHAILIVLAISYIGFLSLAALIVTLACIGAGVATYLLNQKRIAVKLKLAAEQETKFYQLLEHVLQGFKEIRIHRPRNEDMFQNYMTPTAEELRGTETSTSRDIAKIAIYNQGFIYALIASVVFLVPSLTTNDPVAPEIIAKVTAIFLFIIGPLSEVVGSVSLMLRGNRAVINIQKLEGRLDEAHDRWGAGFVGGQKCATSFKEIACEAMVFQYPPDDNGIGFSVGPIDLNIYQGEILFLVGGNGSGKSTLMKLLTGLYFSGAGELKIDGVTLCGENMERYRSLFSIIFTDFHLFDHLFGIEAVDDKEVDDWLTRLQLIGKTGLEGRRFITKDLSTGQKKRLALLVAVLEKRPILMFDEVAADQDPEFRQFFYEVLLVELKGLGKTIIAATHDDRYFGVADRVLKLEYGKIESEQEPKTGKRPGSQPS